MKIEFQFLATQLKRAIDLITNNGIFSFQMKEDKKNKCIIEVDFSNEDEFYNTKILLQSNSIVYSINN